MTKTTLFNRHSTQVFISSLMAAVILLGASLVANASPANTSILAATATVAPTPSPCTDATKVTTSNVGKALCVTGTISSITTDTTASFMKFKGIQFQLISYNLKRDYSVLKNKCIKVSGTVTKLGTRAVLVITDKAVFATCADKVIRIPARTGTAANAPTATTRAANPTTAPQATSTPKAAPTTASTKTTGTVVVKNESQHDVNFTLWGPTNQSFGAAAGSSSSIEVPPGMYGWTSFLNGCQLQAVDNLPIDPSHTVTFYIVPGDNPCGAELYTDIQ